MSDNDSKTSSTFAKNASQLQPNQGFNPEQEFADYIPKLSDQGREKFKMIAELGEQRLKKEVSAQKRHHVFRVMREENKLLKDYISNPAQRPQNHEVSQDLKTIADQAEHNVSQKEARYLESARYDVRQNLQSVISQDFQEQGGQPTSSRSAPDLER